MINSEVRKTHGFYVDIDCLFDTRFSVLESMDEMKAADLLMSGYYTRKRDDFPGFDINEFRKRYKERNIVTLANSERTSLCIHLKQNIEHYIIETIKENLGATVELVLNVYPYKLNPEELNEFVLCLKYTLGGIVPIRVINSPLSEIYPEWIVNNVVAFYCYDWNQWLEYHIEELVKKRIDSSVLIAPKIMPLSHLEGTRQLNELETASKDILYSKSKEYDDLFKDAEDFALIRSVLSTAAINTDFVETREFCILLPDEAPTPPGEFEYH